MRRLSAYVPFAAVPVLIAAAVVGFLVGQQRSPSSASTRSAQTGIASVANALIEYPTSWQPVTGEHPLQPLPFTQKLLLAPGGNTARAGLVGGVLPAGDGPLPSSFLSQLRALPHSEVIGLPAGQAYRYDSLGLPGTKDAVELYVIPGQGAGATALACYAASGFVDYLRQCAQIVAKLTLAGQAHYDLTPDPGYARDLHAVIDWLGKERAQLRRQMAQTSTPSIAAGLASTLAQRFTQASASLARVQPPVAASVAENALASALLRAHDAYRQLVGAVGAHSFGGYEAARGQVLAAEAAVDRALENFALLGYHSR